MTKKSLMIASAIILPLTVGVMAMGIGAGNNHNVANNLFADATSGTITFTGSQTVANNGTVITEGTTRTGGKIYLKATNNGSSASTNVVAALKTDTELHFYEDEDCTIEYTFEDVDSIKFVKNNATTFYSIDLHFLTIEGVDDTISWTKGYKQERTAGFETSGIAPSNVWVTCTNDDSAVALITSMVVTYNCTPKTLTGITIENEPTKVDYISGEYFDPTGLLVKANYSNSTSVATKAYTIVQNRALTSEDTYVTISFGGFTANQSINVSERTYYGTFINTSGTITRTLVLNEDFTGSFTYIQTDATYRNTTQNFTWSINGTTYSFTKTGETAPESPDGSFRYLFGGSGTYSLNNTGSLSGNDILVKLVSYSGNRTSSNTTFVKQ